MIQRLHALAAAAVVLFLLLAGSAEAQGLFSGAVERETYRELLRSRQALYPELGQRVFAAVDQARNERERDALTFLLATSPLSDLAAHDGAFFLGAVRATLDERYAFHWGARVPDSLFLHFVLPLRVNNEALDSARHILPAQLRERVRGLPSMRDVILEINHWCHERVTYAPSDARTRPPLATILNGLGRCGEESVLTTAALRAAGIPARQVYCPRWAHSDDNHAWVEVWADSAWFYLGACEPDVDLNRAWFTEPARRAMLVTAPVQGQYHGEEDVIGGTRLYTRINTLPVYAATQVLNVRVTDSNRVPAAGAIVDFRVFNYGEYYPIAAFPADSMGRVSFRTGYGDLLVWARLGDDHTYRMVKAGKRDTVRLVLEEEFPRSRNVIIEYEPPKAEALSLPPHPQRAAVDERLRRGDSIRSAIEARFVDSTQAAAFALRHGYDTDDAWDVLRDSRGNWRAIRTFLAEGSNVSVPQAMHFLQALRIKDLQDASAEALLDHFRDGMAQMRNRVPGADRFDEITTHEVLNPRIGREELRPWRGMLRAAAAAVFDSAVTARAIAAWVRDSVRLVEDENWSRVPVTPDRVFALRVADEASRDIFFVAFCRAAGLPARLDPATGRPQYHDESGWIDASLGEEEAYTERSAELLLRLPASRSILEPQYARHFTLARFADGIYHTLDFEGDPRLAAWPVRLQLEPGRYQLVTGNRQPDGSVLSTIEEFILEAGVIHERMLHIRDNSTRPEVLAEIDEDLLPLDEAASYVLLWIEEGTEPVSHALLDIAAERRALEGFPLRFLLAGDGSMSADALGRIARASLPENTVVDASGAEELLEELTEELRLPQGMQLPLIVVADAEGNVTFVARGYTVGVGTQILRILERMSLPIEE